MYGDSDAMHRRAQQLREQGCDIAATADRLVAQVESLEWSGRAADALRLRIRDRAHDLRELAHRHETAAESLARHRSQVDALKETIAERERHAATIPGLMPGRLTVVDPMAERSEDLRIAHFTPPPPGHKDWLTVELPGL